MAGKTNVVILMGGRSPEYEVSINSGKNVLENIDKKKYNIFPVIISRYEKGENLEELLRIDRKNKVDVCFIVIHGLFGEDGTLQKKLDKLDIRYTGSGVKASKIGINKLEFRKLMTESGVLVPEKINLSSPTFPCFVKPVGQGSSIGVSPVYCRKDFKPAIKLAQKYGKKILVEELINGLEITVPVLGNRKPFALPVIEIIPQKANFFNYESKYSKGGSKEIVPARISDQLTKKVQQLAVKIYKLVGCRGFARIDFMLKNNKLPVVLEINTIPGLTKASLFPKSAAAAGISCRELIDKIIEYARE